MFKRRIHSFVRTILGTYKYRTLLVLRQQILSGTILAHQRNWYRCCPKRATMTTADWFSAALCVIIGHAAAAQSICISVSWFIADTFFRPPTIPREPSCSWTGWPLIRVPWSRNWRILLPHQSSWRFHPSFLNQTCKIRRIPRCNSCRTTKPRCGPIPFGQSSRWHPKRRSHCPRSFGVQDPVILYGASSKKEITIETKLHCTVLVN